MSNISSTMLFTSATNLTKVTLKSKDFSAQNLTNQPVPGLQILFSSILVRCIFVFSGQNMIFFYLDSRIDKKPQVLVYWFVNPYLACLLSFSNYLFSLKFLLGVFVQLFLQELSCITVFKYKRQH